MRTFPASVPALPAAIPETCVACDECTGSNGRLRFLQVSPGGGNARATITFLVVYAVCPFGKPAGIANAAGEKKGCDWSSPSSRIAIFIPAPASTPGAGQNEFAPIIATLRSSSPRNVVLG